MRAILVTMLLLAATPALPPGLAESPPEPAYLPKPGPSPDRFRGPPAPEGPAPESPGGECAPASDPRVLANGEPSSGTVPPSGQCHFVLAPLPGTTVTRVRLADLADDFDLYVQRGTPPTLESWECRPYLGGITPEDCEVRNDGRPVYVMVYAYSGSGNFSVVARSLVVRYCDDETGNTPLALGVAHEDAIGPDALAMCFFAVPADGSTELLDIHLEPLTSDLDVAGRVGRRPTFAVFDCVSANWGVVEEHCFAPNRAGTTVYILVVNFGGGGEFRLTVRPTERCSLGAQDTPLVPGGSVRGTLANLEGARCYFAVAADAGEALDVRLQPAAGLLDLYVQPGARPEEDPECLRLADLEEEARCVVAGGGAVTYVMVQNYRGGGEFDLSLRAFSVPMLPEGGFVNLTVAAGDPAFFKVVTSLGDLGFTVALAGQPGNLGSLRALVRKGQIGSEDRFDCRAVVLLANGGCAFLPTPLRYTAVQPYAGPGTYYVTFESVSPATRFQATSVVLAAEA